MMINAQKIKENIRIIRERIAKAAVQSSRNERDILLVAVTKTVPPEAIEIAIEEGIAVLGENRVQEAAEKIPKIRHNAVWHMVGHLQSNKAKTAVNLFETIHSIDSIKLARLVDKAAREAGKKLKCLIEVKLSGEESKFGMDPAALKCFLEDAVHLENISISGLMTIPPYDPDPEKSRPYFKELKKLAHEASGWDLQGIALSELSMGMTEDFHIAIEEGATIVRIGRAIFGERAWQNFTS